jgi:hypothetical protein
MNKLNAIVTGDMVAAVNDNSEDYIDPVWLICAAYKLAVLCEESDESEESAYPVMLQRYEDNKELVEFLSGHNTKAAVITVSKLIGFVGVETQNEIINKFFAMVNTRKVYQPLRSV